MARFCQLVVFHCGHVMKIYVAWHAEQRLNNSTIGADGPTPAATRGGAPITLLYVLYLL